MTKKTRIYYRWKTMKHRCYNPKDKAYKWYGGKGIKVCDEWLVFQNYYNWVINQPNYQFGVCDSVDRIDNSKGYSPENCRIIKLSEQQNNETSNRKILQYDLNGNLINEFDSISDASRFLNLNNLKSNSIYKCAKGRQKTGCGFIWKYKEE